MKHNQNFDDFLKNHVNLNQSRINDLDRRVDSITNILRCNMVGYRQFSKQGSYAHETIIKPVKNDDEFDADILVFIRNDNFYQYYYIDYIKRVYDVFKSNENYKSKVKLKTRCCTVDYAGEVHVDIVPCIEHRNSKFICNRDSRSFERTDGEEYSNWLNQKNRIVGGNNLKKVIRLIKFLRDHKDNFSIPSILLTTILANQVREQDKYNSKEFFDLVETLKTLSNRVNDWLQLNYMMPVIKNPALYEENFNRNWNDNQYRNFRDKFNTYTKKINDACYEADRYRSVKKWQELFGDEFGE